MKKVNSSRHKKATRKKVSREQSVEWNGTHIDDLPEAIIVHILSLLPTKDAVKTSILAKRWKCLWMVVRNLHFREEIFPIDSERKVFLDSVDRVLSLRESSNIYKFSISCQVEFEARRINSWLSTVVDHKVQVLKLRFFDPFCYVLPSSLFTSESLTELKINMFEQLKLPSHVSLPRLKILTLKHVKFVDENSMYQLFSGCVVLEKLTLEECEWDNLYSVRIFIPTLKILLIFESSEDMNNCEVLIIGKKLVTFDYGGDLKNDYCLQDFSSLVDSSIVVGSISDIVEEGRQREVASRAHKILRGLSNARDLYLSYETVEVLNYADEFFTLLPVYRNLTFLRVNLGSINFNCGALQSLLQKSPSLVTLEFVKGISLELPSEQDEWKLDPVPPCFSTHLKTIYLGDFRGTPPQMQVVKALLQHAQVLDRLCIKSWDYNEDYNATLYLPLRSNGGEMCIHR